MLNHKKRSSHRLSSLFSISSSESRNSVSVPSSESSSTLSKVRQRITSSSRAPDYPPPAPPSIPSNAPATIQPVESTSAPVEPLEPLEPPPTISGSQSRSSSPGRLSKSRPGTAGNDSSPALLAPEVLQKKNRRRSRLFGGGESSDERLHDTTGQNDPLAWVVGHKGKVPYNLTMLLNGEKVGALWPHSCAETNLLDRLPNCGMMLVTLSSICSQGPLTRVPRSASILPSTLRPSS